MIQPEKPLKVGEIAKTFGVDPNTVRNWCERYADYLSDSAKPPTGGVRLFSSRDFAVLAYVHSALNGGMIHDEIAMKMAETGFNANGEPIIVGLAEVLPPQAEPTPQEGQGEALGTQVVLSTMQGRIEAVERRLETRERDAIWWARGEGMLIGMVAMMGLLFLAWLLVNGGT